MMPWAKQEGLCRDLDVPLAKLKQYGNVSWAADIARRVAGALKEKQVRKLHSEEAQLSKTLEERKSKLEVRCTLKVPSRLQHVFRSSAFAACERRMLDMSFDDRLVVSSWAVSSVCESLRVRRQLSRAWFCRPSASLLANPEPHHDGTRIMEWFKANI